MKQLSKLLVLSMVMATAFWSCEKDENQIFLEEGTAPVLTSSVATTIPLAFATKDNESIKLSWTNPNYTFTTGVSSQDVAYEIQIDTTGANFTNPKKKSLSISKELSYSFTQTELNDYLLNAMELKPGMSHNLEIRVKASLNTAAILYSNVIKLKTTPYAIPPKVEPPTNGTLWVTGNAFASNWTNPLPDAPVNFASTQKFTKKSETLYELVVPMLGGGGFKLIQINGDWGTQYSKKSGDPLSGEFEKKDATQFDGPTAAGTYKITVDFQTGKYSLVAQ
jgi:hypothetical protein